MPSQVHAHRSLARLLAGSLVLAGALGLGVLGAAPALAAEPAVTLDNGDGLNAFIYLPVEVSGTCTDGSTSAVVTLTQGGDVLDQVAVDIAADGTWAADLDATAGDEDFANVALDCLAYGSSDPVGSADLAVFLVSYASIEVTASPSTLRIGERLTVTGQCPAGTTDADVLVFNPTTANSSDREPPVLATVAADATGLVSWTGTIAPRADLTPGDGAALVICGDGNDTGITYAVGSAPLTLLEAAVTSPPTTPDTTGPASATPADELAMTGSATTPLSLLALTLLLGGLGLRVASTRLTRRTTA